MPALAGRPGSYARAKTTATTLRAQHVRASPRTRVPAGAVHLGGVTYERAAAPDRTLLHDAGGVLLATFTDGSRSLVLAGPARTFSEGTTTASVTTTSWVRLLVVTATSAVDPAWLGAALADRTTDVPAVAAQHAPECRWCTAPTARVSSDASRAGGMPHPGSTVAPSERSARRRTRGESAPAHFPSDRWRSRVAP